MNRKLIKKIIKVFVIFIGVISTSILIILVFLHFSFNDMCGNEIYQTIQSPNKKMQAVIFQRDCGATTGFSTQISIQDKKKRLPNEPGNVFIAEGEPNNSLIQINWENDGILEIQENFPKPYLKVENYKGIQIEYKK